MYTAPVAADGYIFETAASAVANDPVRWTVVVWTDDPVVGINGSGWRTVGASAWLVDYSGEVHWWVQSPLWSAWVGNIVASITVVQSTFIFGTAFLHVSLYDDL